MSIFKTAYITLSLVTVSLIPLQSVMAENASHEVSHASPVSSSTHGDTAVDTHAEIHWDYKGAGAPEKWGYIKGDYKSCRLGKFQSPINLTVMLDASLSPLEINYNVAPLSILNNGHTVQVNYPEGSFMTVGGVRFNLLQFHFHAPSEHTIKGKTYEMEMHLVHKTNDGKLGVLGVMIEEGAYNQNFAQLWSKLPMEKTDVHTYADIQINPVALLPDVKDYYRYMGSLTTPPCSEGVHWHVLKAPIQMSLAQIDKFKGAFSGNARPVQNTGHRMIIGKN